MSRIRSVFAVLVMSALMAAFAVAPSLAQQNQSGLVNVGIDIDNDGDIEAGTVDVIVQLPVGIAANVCPNLSANVLAANIGTNQVAECDASVEQLLAAEQNFQGDQGQGLGAQ